jgi:NAD(P)-dependent dehydrogenase (short-subunit alcohol dehydrogenase family)
MPDHAGPSRQSSQTPDPRHAGPKPPYPQSSISYPGSDAELTPQADHGEASYEGTGQAIGKRVLITGGDSGIGRAVAIAFAREGADVAISYLPEEQEDADETRRWIESAGRRALCLPGDLQNEDYCAELPGAVAAEWGGLDVVVNNAAFQTSRETLEELTTADMERTFRTNIYAPLWVTRAALPLMQAGSSVINTASIQAFTPSPNLMAYAATKAALVNVSKSLAMPKEKIERFGQDTAFARAAQPAEMAPLFVFLASDAARYITGEVFGATGGQTPY